MFSDDDWVHPSVMCLLVGCCFTFGFVNDGARQCCRLLYECPEIYTFVCHSPVLGCVGGGVS